MLFESVEGEMATLSGDAEDRRGNLVFSSLVAVLAFSGHEAFGVDGVHLASVQGLDGPVGGVRGRREGGGISRELFGRHFERGEIHVPRHSFCAVGSGQTAGILGELTLRERGIDALQRDGSARNGRILRKIGEILVQPLVASAQSEEESHHGEFSARGLMHKVDLERKSLSVDGVLAGQMGVQLQHEALLGIDGSRAHRRTNIAIELKLERRKRKKKKKM